jgi:hypothetical protein
MADKIRYPFGKDENTVTANVGAASAYATANEYGNDRQHTTILTLTGDLPARMTQVQGGLWITEREWCDVVAWNPAMSHLPPVVVRVWRDEEYIEDLARCVNRLVASVDEHVERIRAYGIAGRREEIRPVTLIEALEGSLPFEGN